MSSSSQRAAAAAAAAQRCNRSLPHLLLLVASLLLAAARCPAAAAAAADPPHGLQPTASGYVPLPSKPGSSLYWAFWEAQSPVNATSTPILLWLQGGPGCSSVFGAFYELGPYVLAGEGDAKKLTANPYSWNAAAGLLVIDQPVGVGYSVAASKAHIPADMQGMAADLYAGLWAVMDAQPQLQQRPLFITGESFAGRYVPSLAHYILQLESERAQAGNSQQRCVRHPVAQRPTAAAAQQVHAPRGWPWSSLLQGWLPWTGASSSHHHAQQQQLQASRRLLQQQQQDKQQQQQCWAPRHPRALNLASVPGPNFRLVGAAIGNGLTDPVPQTRALASVVYDMGLVSEATQEEISERIEEVVQMVYDQQAEWEQATAKRSALLEFIQSAAGLATLLDVRRLEAYDADHSVDKLLRDKLLREWMGATAPEAANYTSCSPVVEAVMASDVMRSAAVLVEDLLDVLPLLLYQGQFDVQDGVASTDAWIKGLNWRPHLQDFLEREGELWYAEAAAPLGKKRKPAAAAGWRRQAATLTQVVVRNAGHMVPRDQPQAAQRMMHDWVAGVLADEEGRGTA